MTKTRIEWADYTLNVSIGCKHACWYCYAEKINNRFKFIENWKEPVFLPEKLNFNTPKIPKRRNYIAGAISPHKPVVFLVSMGDLFGSWQKESDIQKVIDMAASKPDITFMSLTKSPANALDFLFPDNWIFGVTIEGLKKYDLNKMLDYYENINCYNKFISAEPLMGKHIPQFTLHGEFMIIGSMTGPGAIKPEKEWLDIPYMHNMDIYFKQSILSHFGKKYWDEKLEKFENNKIYQAPLQSIYGIHTLEN